MELQNSFTVTADPQTVWAHLLEVDFDGLRGAIGARGRPALDAPLHEPRHNIHVVVDAEAERIDRNRLGACREQELDGLDMPALGGIEQRRRSTLVEAVDVDAFGDQHRRDIGAAGICRGQQRIAAEPRQVGAPLDQPLEQRGPR